MLAQIQLYEERDEEIAATRKNKNLQIAQIESTQIALGARRDNGRTLPQDLVCCAQPGPDSHSRHQTGVLGAADRQSRQMQE